MDKLTTLYLKQMFSGYKKVGDEKKEKDKLNNDETVPYLNVKSIVA